MRLSQHINETFRGKFEIHKEFIEFKLISVDVGGIWIESQLFNDLLFKSLNTTMLERTPIVFVPFSGIHWIVSLVDAPALSDTALQ